MFFTPIFQVILPNGFICVKVKTDVSILQDGNGVQKQASLIHSPFGGTVLPGPALL